ncbi:hypothetical protein IPN41_01090 [Candidatus Falkowbacteria bacterium]|nr:MAG: hypothetical protein IPN41_01090 [Candidatus Falkowbacteria bacterium]
MKKFLNVLFILLFVTIGCSNEKNEPKFSISPDSEEYFNRERTSLILGYYISLRKEISCETEQTLDGPGVCIIYIPKEIEYISSAVGDPYSSLSVKYKDVQYTLSCPPAKDIIIKYKD